MAEVRSEVEQLGTRVVVRLHGQLCGLTAPRVRTVLLKCLVEQPDALVVDLSGLAVTEANALSVFAAVARQAHMWPGTPIMLGAPDPETADLLARGRYGRLGVFPTVAEALAAEPPSGMCTLSESLLPVSGAARRARRLAAEVCSRWGLPHLADAAGVVAGELVTNAVVHAHTMIDLKFSLGGRHLLIAVRDGSTEAPRPDAGELTDPLTGRGLMLVGAMSRRWGTLPTEGGKVVWAGLSRSASQP